MEDHPSERSMVLFPVQYVSIPLAGFLHKADEEDDDLSLTSYNGDDNMFLLIVHVALKNARRSLL